MHAKIHTQLHDLIGQKIIHNNNACMLIEIIDSGPLLVFQCQTKKEIQQDQHGNASRRTQPTFTIHCLNEFKTDLHPVLISMLKESEYTHWFKTLTPN